MPDELKIVTTVSNEAEAEMVCESLSEAGIRSMPQMSSGNIRLGLRPRSTCTSRSSTTAGREVLNAAVPSDEELARLSHEAGEESAP
jgi:hypothetical protein